MFLWLCSHASLWVRPLPALGFPSRQPAAPRRPTAPLEAVRDDGRAPLPRWHLLSLSTDFSSWLLSMRVLGAPLGTQVPASVHGSPHHPPPHAAAEALCVSAVNPPARRDRPFREDRDVPPVLTAVPQGPAEQLVWYAPAASGWVGPSPRRSWCRRGLRVLCLPSTRSPGAFGRSL